MTDIPAGAQRSDDGQWWWDGTQWQPVSGAAAGAGASGDPAGAGATGDPAGAGTAAGATGDPAGGGATEAVGAVQVAMGGEAVLFEEPLPQVSGDDPTALA